MDTDKLNSWLSPGANIGVQGAAVLDRVGYLQWHLGNAVGQKWWATLDRFYPEEFADLIDDALAKENFGSNRRLIDSMFSGEAGAARIKD